MNVPDYRLDDLEFERWLAAEIEEEHRIDREQESLFACVPEDLTPLLDACMQACNVLQGDYPLAYNRLKVESDKARRCVNFSRAFDEERERIAFEAGYCNGWDDHTRDGVIHIAVRYSEWRREQEAGQ